MSDWVILLLLVIVLIVIISILNARSDAFAEEIRKSKVVEILPLTEGDVRKFLAKKSISKRNLRSSHNTQIDFSKFDEFSPLKLLGYTVGANGLSNDERVKVLNLAIYGNFQNYMPQNINYDNLWGLPGSKKGSRRYMTILEG